MKETLTEKELDCVSGGKIRTVRENPGGQELPDNSNAQGEPIETSRQNPAGKEPPGQQP